MSLMVLHLIAGLYRKVTVVLEPIALDAGGENAEDWLKAVVESKTKRRNKVYVLYFTKMIFNQVYRFKFTNLIIAGGGYDIHVNGGVGNPAC